MHAVRFNTSECVDPAPSPGLSEHSLRIINHLRLVALGCRSSARVDLDQACALLLANPADANMRHAEILVRGYKQAVVKRAVFYRPGTSELSFDEAWLGRLFEALEREDDDSFRFLIQSRVPRWTRRNLAYLVHSISEQFRKN